MMRVLTPEAMSEVDRVAIEEIGVPGLVLMENAAIGVADAIGRSFPEVDSVIVVCGPGNNGGDGLALGRQLSVRGYRVQLVLVMSGRAPTADASIQLKICRKLGISMMEVCVADDVGRLINEFRHADLIVDALFGTGLKRPLEGLLTDIVTAVNLASAPVVAVDIPSGLEGGSAKVIGPHMEARLTVTFGALKTAHVFPPASLAVGEVVIADLGIPLEIVEAAGGQLHLQVGEEVARLFVPRSDECHKGDFGHLLILAGSTGKAGAAILAARGALRIGSGLVSVAVPEPLLAIVEVGSIESMTIPLPATSGHTGVGGGGAAASLDHLLRALVGKQALAVGPGLGIAEETADTIRELIAGSMLPLVLDADGLNAVAGRPELIVERQGATILTPHEGELARLLDVSRSRISEDRVAASQAAAAKYQAIVVLKGPRTLIVDPGGETYANSTGNGGMASGGMGDVLTGMIGALLGMGYEPLAAAQVGVYLHGLAGDLGAQELSAESLTAGDLLDFLPDAIRSLASA
jgi:hydroxyethylthiazole kinase-like uncharacterized protein yjeF